MSRAIKFRAWIPAKKTKEHEYHTDGTAKMFYQDDQYLQSFLRRAYMEDCGREHESYISPGFTLLQYTGLKDKTGREIYEGDICRVSRHGTCEVEFKLGCFFFVGEGGWANEITNRHSGSSCEVIGNVYANPELLTPN